MLQACTPAKAVFGFEKWQCNIDAEVSIGPSTEPHMRGCEVLRNRKDAYVKALPGLLRASSALVKGQHFEAHVAQACCYEQGSVTGYMML